VRISSNTFHINNSMNKINTDVDEQRAYINRALSSGRFDNAFCGLCRTLAKSNHNLTKVCSDIDLYGTSHIGQSYRYMLNTKSVIEKYEKPLVLNLTSRFKLDTQTVKSIYEYLIKHISSLFFKNAYKRHNKTILNIAYAEGGVGRKNAHIHSVINVPPDVSVSDAKKIIKAYWYKNTGTVQFDEDLKAKDKVSQTAAYLAKMKSKIETVPESFIQI